MRGTTKALVTIALGATLVARPVAAQETSPGEEFGLAVGAAAANLLYTPAKVVVAFGGLVVGSLTGLLTGGDVRAAYDGTEPVEFFGSDYADTPSTALEAESGGIYDAQYSM
jgi:hypothetical protein